MSYILDALKKSESERRQGRVPDLGSSVQMIHRRRRKSLHWSLWLTLALLLNAVVFAVIFWPRDQVRSRVRASQASVNTHSAAATVPAVEPVKIKNQVQMQTQKTPGTATAAPPKTPVAKAPQPRPEATQTPSAAPATPPEPARKVPAVAVAKGATLIRPHQAPVVAGQDSQGSDSNNAVEPQSDIPELSDMSQSFQEQVPDLHFNGHIYSSDPGARRVMINDVYLGEGDHYQGLRIDRITPHGVVMSLNGRAFRVGVVQDWNSPN